MNRIINIYADVESFYDYRRGLLQWLMTEGIEDPDKRKYEGDRLWELRIADNYRKRRLDTFSYPEFNIDKEKFTQLYLNRGVKHWASGMYYPTPLIKKMLSTVIELENLDERPIDIKEIRLQVNTYPYNFGPELTELLVEQIRIGMKGLVKVTAIHCPHNMLDASFYGQFGYVFRYNFMLDEDSTAFMDSFKSAPSPDTYYVIPDILARDTDLFVGEVSELMAGVMSSLAPAGRFIPISRNLFDYA